MQMLTVEIHTFSNTLTVKQASKRSLTSGRWAAEGAVGEHRIKVAGEDSDTHPHRVALAAAIGGLSTLRRPCAVELHTDSAYLLQGAVTWFRLGMSLGWTKDPKGHRIRNHFLWGQLRDVALRHDIQWHGPRRFDEEAVGIFTDHQSEVWGRTEGRGPDVGYAYSGRLLPWDPLLGEFRAFTEEEITAGAECDIIVPDDTEEPERLTWKQKQARNTIITRVAERYRPEYIKREVNGHQIITLSPNTVQPLPATGASQLAA